MITFWYPAVAQAGVSSGLFVDKQVAMSGIYNSRAYCAGANFAAKLRRFSRTRCQTRRWRPICVKYPVVLYSPGSEGHRRENTDKAEDLASWGYVVVGLDHRDTYLSVFPDGTVVHGQDWT